MYLSDFHTHSCLSQDGSDSLLDMALSAEKAGLSELCITDHIECNECEPVQFSTTPEKSLNEFCKAKQLYTGNVKLLFGVELGQATQNMEISYKALSFTPYDFVIASLHNCRDRDDFYYMDFTKVDINSLLRQYYIEVMELCELGKFDVLGHMTYFLRYTAQQGISVDMSLHRNAISEIMQYLIKNGKGIEVNTSGMRGILKEPSPNFELVKLYKALGGEIITVGSDAHRASDVGKGIPEVLEMIKATGFKAYTVYEKRVPRFVGI